MELPTADESLAVILASWKKDPKSVLRRFDENNDERIDSAEWEKAVLIAKKELHEQKVTPSSAQIDNLIGKPTDSRKPFLISTQDETTLTWRFQYKAWASLALFFVLGVGAVWAINIRL